MHAIDDGTGMAAVASQPGIGGRHDAPRRCEQITWSGDGGGDDDDERRRWWRWWPKASPGVEGEAEAASIGSVSLVLPAVVSTRVWCPPGLERREPCPTTPSRSRPGSFVRSPRSTRAMTPQRPSYSSITPPSHLSAGGPSRISSRRTLSFTCKHGCSCMMAGGIPCGGRLSGRS